MRIIFLSFFKNYFLIRSAKFQNIFNILSLPQFHYTEEDFLCIPLANDRIGVVHCLVSKKYQIS